MTIAKRLMILLAVPLLILVGIGIFTSTDGTGSRTAPGSWRNPASWRWRGWGTSPGASLKCG